MSPPLPSNQSPENRARGFQARRGGLDAVAAARSRAGQAGSLGARNERMRGAVSLPSLSFLSGART